MSIFISFVSFHNKNVRELFLLVFQMKDAQQTNICDFGYCKMNKASNTISKCYRHPRKIVVVIGILTTLFIITLRRRVSHSVQSNYQQIEKHLQSEVLLIYVYSKTHSHALGNLKYFIEHAVQENDGVDYYFILQNVNNKTVDESELPSLPPSNARYIQHENVCYDFGTVGWFFKTYTVGNPWTNQTNITDPEEKKINITHYRYFILINSSIRGPFFPPYYLKFVADYKKEFDKSFYWYYIFTKRINDKVKLVGCTISCIPIPHVQSYLLVTDFIGLSLLLKPSAGKSNGIFACYALKIHASFNSEVPSSTRILDAGYMIDCVLTKYQTINFLKPHNRLCNQHRNPYVDNNFEGTQLEPYEVIFMKYSDTPDTQVGRRRCELYERWMRDATKQNRSIW